MVSETEGAPSNEPTPRAQNAKGYGVAGVCRLRDTEHAADPADGLPDAMLVLDERETDEALAAGAEADTGYTAARPSCARSSAKASEPRSANASGTGAHANIVARGRGRSQPMRASPSQSTSRRER